jgi:hypothetical protein
VLCDQLEVPGVVERCYRNLVEIRPASHRLDADEFRRAGEVQLHEWTTIVPDHVVVAGA